MCGTNHTEHASFTPDQQNYLDKLIAGLDLQASFQGGSEGGGGGAATPLTVHGTPFEDLAKEEVAKHERHPWDYWPVLREHAEQAKDPEGIDVFMIKHHGLFHVAPAQPGFMTRLRIPACKMRGDQLAGLADMSEDLAGGYAHVTTRGNLQLREIPPDRIVDLLTGLYDIGLTSRGSGADSVRNITASPSAGFDPTELIDLSPYAVALHHHILNTRHLHGIPRKFNIAFDNGGSLSCVSDTNDIGYLATDVLENEQGVEPGVYCRVLLGGITGHLDFARDSGYLVKPEHTVDASIAMLEVFIEHGDRTNRKKARLKYVLDEHGFDWYIEKSQEKLDAMGTGASFIKVEATLPTAPRNPIDRSAHIGVHPQSEPGQNYLGVALPVGRLLPDQMRGLAGIAARYGKNDIRLTVWQNLLIPHIADADVPAALEALDALGLSTKASSFAAGAVACTGKFGCKYASAHTKQHAAILVDHLQSRFDTERMTTPINIHLTGCPHSCAQHYIGDIGLLGATTPEGEEAYQVYLGGGSDHDQGIARYLAGPVAADLLPVVIEQVMDVYFEHRESEDETFVAFTRRHDDDAFHARFAQTPTHSTDSTETPVLTEAN